MTLDDRGSRAAQNADRPRQARMDLRCRDRMIERRLGLVIRPVVAFVRHDQAQVGQRRKQAERAPMTSLSRPARALRHVS